MGVGDKWVLVINNSVAVDVAIALVPHVHRKHLAPTYRPPQFQWVSEQNAQRQLSRPFFPPKRSGSARLPIDSFWRQLNIPIHRAVIAASYETHQGL